MSFFTSLSMLNKDKGKLQARRGKDQKKKVEKKRDEKLTEDVKREKKSRERDEKSNRKFESTEDECIFVVPTTTIPIEVGLCSIADLSRLMIDPEITELFQDPGVRDAFADISLNPQNVAKHQSNAKVMKVLEKISTINNSSSRQRSSNATGMDKS